MALMLLFFMVNIDRKERTMLKGIFLLFIAVGITLLLSGCGHWDGWGGHNHHASYNGHSHSHYQDCGHSGY